MRMMRDNERWIGNLCRMVALGLGISLLVSKVAYAGGLSIWPVHVKLSPETAVQEVQISNPTTEKSYVQIMAVDWHEPGNLDQAARVEDILAMPPVFELGPADDQLVRITTRDPIQDDLERSYRLVVTEVPRTAGLVPNSLAIAARMTLPIFVTPNGAEPTPVWKVENFKAKEPKLIFANQGNAHIQIKNVELIPEGTDQPAFETSKGGLVLAGEDMSWPIQANLATIEGPLIIKAKTSIGPLEAAVSIPES